LPLDPADLDWTDEGAPRSQRFGDIYFSREGGLDETRAVFLQGCGLPGAWKGRSHFSVAELGFGTGLNILALLELWAETRAPGQTLSIFSIEAYPLPREDAARALSAWPQLAPLSRSLLDAWPRRAPGFHRIAWPELGATLDLAQGEALWALEQWTATADAWFLDGFSPALNPGMWRDEVLAAVAARSAPGAVLATFTVAGAVRRGLQAAGFTVDKRPGHGAKRERLEANFPGEQGLAPPAPTVAVIGAGIAGAALVRALTALGIDPVIVEAEGSGAGSSGNPAALVTPALDAGGGARARLYAQAFARAVDLYRAAGPAVIAGEGVVQLESTERDGPRFDAVVAGDVFEPGALERLNSAQAAAALGHPAQDGAVRFTEGLVVRPPALLGAWLGGARRLTARVASLQRRARGGWILLDEGGVALLEADVVCLAAGAQVDALLDQPLPLLPVRGQASWAEGLALPIAAAWGGYAATFDGGLLFGATHDRGRTDTAVDPADHERNLGALTHALPAVAEAARLIPLKGRASIRAAAYDRMPVAGAVDEGLYVLGGLGSRGFTTAPLLAEHLAALIAGTPSPMPRDLQATVEPSRLRKK
jgi:tRNA 5-methylaminomethyl-2-thiouridine biosynthesis bifunctional protein